MQEKRIGTARMLDEGLKHNLTLTVKLSPYTYMLMLTCRMEESNREEHISAKKRLMSLCSVKLVVAKIQEKKT